MNPKIIEAVITFVLLSIIGMAVAYALVVRNDRIKCVIKHGMEQCQ